jgi:hydrogenase small subunit
MIEQMTVYEGLRRRGVSRRGFLKLCAYTSSILALPAGSGRFMAEALAATPRPSVIWLSFQECTGCTESFTRSFDPTLENLILGQISLDYHHTLQAAAGIQAEEARETAMRDHYGSYVLIVDGSVSEIDGGYWSTFGGESNLDVLRRAAQGAAVILSIGNCAAYGGVAAAQPNPTLAQAVDAISAIDAGKVINVPGCPPIPEVIGGVIAYYLTYGTAPELDGFRRPKVFFGKTVHDTCARKESYKSGFFAESFDDDKARQGACLYLLGCYGTRSKNACSTVKWNQGVSYPMFSGHGCLGCSEPDFWDREGGLYGVAR